MGRNSKLFSARSVTPTNQLIKKNEDPNCEINQLRKEIILLKQSQKGFEKKLMKLEAENKFSIEKLRSEMGLNQKWDPHRSISATSKPNQENFQIPQGKMPQFRIKS